MFLGIRCSKLWGRDVTKQVDDPKFIDGLRRVADADQVLETNGGTPVMQTMVKINDKIPNLRIMLEHLAVADPTPAQQADYDAVMKEIHGRPNIWAKLSSEKKGWGLAARKARLDQLMETFGEDRVVFGTNWPDSWGAATPAQIVDITRAYFATRSRAEAEKCFWKNSLVFYKWKQRAKNQPSL
jgi:predicted TIM-barrel fold metal-dependent hydrolase